MSVVSKSYTCKVFLKNIRIQQEIVIDANTQIVQSYDGYTCYDSTAYMVNYLKTVTDSDARFDVQKLAKDYAKNMPVCVIKIWNLKASNVEEAARLAVSKSEPIIKFLAYHQSQSPETFGVTATSSEEGTYLMVLPVTYCGWKIQLMDDINMSARYISERIEKDEKFNLYLTLYSDATSENKLDFKIVKLWTILETMAASFLGTKEQKVRNLLLDYEIGIRQVESYDLIKLAYMHRNAVVHEGTSDPKMVSPKFVNYITISTKNKTKIVEELEELVNFILRWYMRRTT
jgi:hypothetical protein